MKIEIRHEKFNDEFHADIEISPGEFKYISSNCIKELFESILVIIKSHGLI